jgi:hypothetical protein
VHYVFETGNRRYQEQASAILDRVSMVPELGEQFSYNSHAFWPRLQAMPLQAADLLAWEFQSAFNRGASPVYRKLTSTVKTLHLRYNEIRVFHQALANASFDLRFKE